MRPKNWVSRGSNICWPLPLIILNVRQILSCTKEHSIGLWFTHTGQAMTVRVEEHRTLVLWWIAPQCWFLKQWLPPLVVSLVGPRAPGLGCIWGLTQAVMFREAREVHVRGGGDCVKLTGDVLHFGQVYWGGLVTAFHSAHSVIITVWWLRKCFLTFSRFWTSQQVRQHRASLTVTSSVTKEILFHPSKSFFCIFSAFLSIPAAINAVK